LGVGKTKGRNRKGVTGKWRWGGGYPSQKETGKKMERNPTEKENKKKKFHRDS